MSQEFNAPAKPSVKVRGWVDPFHPQATAFGCVMAGTTVADAISKACKVARTRKRYMRRGLVYLGRKTAQGDYKWTRIPQSAWNKVRLKPNDSLTFRLLPEGGGGGGKNPLRAILNIVVMAVAVVAAVWTAGLSMFAVGPSLFGGAVTLGGLVAGSVAGGLVMTMGQMLVDKIAPIKQPSFSGPTAADHEDVYSLSGSSNTIDKWGTVPILFGKGRIAPKKAAAPYTELVGDDMYLHELFIWGECGSGDIAISDMRLGETSIAEYDEVEVHTWRFDPDDPWYSDIYPTGIQQEDLNINLKNAEGYYIRQSKPKASKISIDINFPSLVYFNDRGDANATSVELDITYRKVGATDWTIIGEHIINDGGTFAIPDIRVFYRLWVYIDTENNTINSAYSRYDRPPSGIVLYKLTEYFVEDDGFSHILSGFEYTTTTVKETEWVCDDDGQCYWVTKYRITSITVNGGRWSWNKGHTIITASSTSPVRRTFTIENLDGMSAYEVRIKRVTGDSDNNTRTQNDSYWAALRTHFNDRPFNIGYPAVFTALRVKATDQLSGAISNLTGQYQAIMQSYNQTTAQWEMVETRDLIPAIRHVLQECSARPQPDSVIDWNNFIETDAYWKARGWKYDKVLDSQTSVLNIIQDICAAGLASPTFIDGKWAVIVDKPRDEVVMGITSANSWGWSVDRVTSELPDVIQCDFINEATWETDMMEVVTETNEAGTPLYVEEGRTPIYEKVAFDGVTIPDNVYKQARFHYADAKTQVRTISMTMWDESLVATRGDLVSLSQPYLIPAGLEAGRVKSVTTNDQGYITKITTDVLNTVSTVEGLGIKIYMSDGKIAHAKLAINQTGDEQTKTLVFAEPITANIERGNKYTLGYYGEEDFLAVITSMKFNADLTCQLTCIDYVEDKYKVFDPDFPIPEFKSLITRPIYAATTLTPPPVVQQVVTDEGAIIRIGTTLKSRAIVYFGAPSQIDRRAHTIRCAYRVHNTLVGSKEAVPGKWVVFANIPVSETVVFCNDVEEGQYYDFRFQYVSSVGYTSEWTYIDNVKIIGKTTPPPTAKNLQLEPYGASGIRGYWNKTDVIDFDHYKLILTGNGFTTWTGVTKDLELITPIWKWTGTLTGSLYNVDIIGLESKEPAVATYDILPPAVPEIESSILNNTFILSWQECNTTWPIKYYKVEDPYMGKTFNVADEWTSIEARIADKYYQFIVTSVDVFDNTSAPNMVDVYIPGIASFASNAVVEGDTIKITWDREFAPFDIDYYEVFSVDDDDDTQLTSVAHIKGNTYSVPVSGTGTKNFKIQAVDIAGNRSPMSECNADIEAPYAPTDFNAKIVDDHIELVWADPYKARPSGTRLPVLSYDVIRQWTVTRPDGITETHEEDYGTYDALNLSVPAVIAGTHTFMVRARDTGGNTGAWAITDLTIFVPNRVSFYNCSAVDNNVMLYWQEPSITSFPIASYILYDVDEDSMMMERGRTDSLFSAQIESQAGQYTYAVRAMDVAGNIGSVSMISIMVSQPPDFIMYYDYDSLFNGDRENIVLSGDGYMFGPVIENETWDDNVLRVASLTGNEPDGVTWQTKLDAGYNLFMSPTIGKATYTETIDVGVEVPSTKITITPTRFAMEGNPELVCKIEISSDGTLWREMADNAFAVYATSFRYVRITLTWTGGMLRIDNINFKLDVKRINDAGRAYADKDDNGEGWVSMEETPMLTGTWIPFNVFFTDIESLPRPNVINDTEGYTAFTVFEDKVYPTGFRAFVLDKNGNRVSAQVDWSAFGV